MPLPGPPPSPAPAMQSPPRFALHKRLYTLCIWARMADDSPSTNVSTTIAIISSIDQSYVYGSPPVSDNTPNSVFITRAWRRFCAREMQVSQGGVVEHPGLTSTAS